MIDSIDTINLALHVDNRIIVSSIIYFTIVSDISLFILNFAWWPLSDNSWSRSVESKSLSFGFFLLVFLGPGENYLIIGTIINALRPWFLPVFIWLKLFLVNSLHKTNWHFLTSEIVDLFLIIDEFLFERISRCYCSKCCDYCKLHYFY